MPSVHGFDVFVAGIANVYPVFLFFFAVKVGKLLGIAVAAERAEGAASGPAVPAEAAEKKLPTVRLQPCQRRRAAADGTVALFPD